METQNNSSLSRIESIDQFRGFAILLMVLANYLGNVEHVPPWLKHAPDVGLTIVDLVEPMFFFAIGLTYGLSVGRRVDHDGWSQTIEHFFRRFAALFGIGAFFTVGSVLAGVESCASSWDVLQTIAIAGLLTLAVVRLPTGFRTVVGLALLWGYQVLLDNYWLNDVLNSSNGGMQGTLGWTAMLILATVLADLFHRSSRMQRLYPWAAALTVVVGIGLSFLVPVSKHRISASYVLISVGICGLIFWGFHHFTDNSGVRLPLLSVWGKNPLLLYCLHNFLLSIFVLPGVPGWYTQAPSWLVVLQVSGLVGILSWVGWYLHRKNWVFSL